MLPMEVTGGSSPDRDGRRHSTHRCGRFPVVRAAGCRSPTCEVIDHANPPTEPKRLGAGQHPSAGTELTRLPDGYVTVGDALCAFNPVYGRGHDRRRHRGHGAAGVSNETGGSLPARFLEGRRRDRRSGWDMAVGEDLRLPPRCRAARLDEGPCSQRLPREAVAGRRGPIRWWCSLSTRPSISPSGPRVCSPLHPGRVCFPREIGFRRSTSLVWSATLASESGEDALWRYLPDRRGSPPGAGQSADIAEDVRIAAPGLEQQVWPIPALSETGRSHRGRRGDAGRLDGGFRRLITMSWSSGCNAAKAAAAGFLSVDDWTAAQLQRC